MESSVINDAQWHHSDPVIYEPILIRAFFVCYFVVILDEDTAAIKISQVLEDWTDPLYHYVLSVISVYINL